MTPREGWGIGMERPPQKVSENSASFISRFALWAAVMEKDGCNQHVAFEPGFPRSRDGTSRVRGRDRGMDDPNSVVEIVDLNFYNTIESLTI